MENADADAAQANEPGRWRRTWERFLELIGIDRGPDTTEDLEQEIQDLLEEGEEQGLISSHEEKLIASIFDFRETLTSEIMTPAAEMVRAEKSCAVPDLIRLVSREGYTRIPIYRDSPDNIVGIVHAKDLLKACANGLEQAAADEPLFTPPYFVSESKPITELLREFQSRKIHMAIVTDEFGGVRGLVTMEDVIEEIVGDIDDEYDRDEGELRVVNDHLIIVDAKIDVEDVAEHFGIELPPGPYESVGGLVIHALGRVPYPGTAVRVGGLTFRVLASDRRRIRTVKVSHKPDEQ